MKRVVLFLIALLLSACSASPPATDGEAGEIPASSAEDWAGAYADALLADDDNRSGMLTDIDGDGVPEAVIAEPHGGILRILGFENGKCAVWFDAETEPLQNISFRQVNGSVKCVATYVAGRNGYTKSSVYELEKGTNESGEPCIVPTVISETVCSFGLELYDHLASEIETVTEAQDALFNQTISTLGDEVSVNTIAFSFGETDRETVVEKLREW